MAASELLKWLTEIKTQNQMSSTILPEAIFLDSGQSSVVNVGNLNPLFVFNPTDHHPVIKVGLRSGYFWYDGKSTSVFK